MEITVVYVVVALIGICIGSFLNVLIDRLPKGEQISRGRSHCDYCKKPLRWFELIPVLSFIVQKGRCLRCRRRLSIQYPLIELATAAGTILIFREYQSSLPQLLSIAVFFYSMTVIFMADLKYRIIPDSMVIVSGAASVVYQFTRIAFDAASWVPILGTAAGSSLFFFLVWLVTKKRGMGFGDVKLVFVLGLALGYPRAIVALYLAFLTGAIAGVILVLHKRTSLKAKIAFGPFLILGAASSIVWGDRLFAWWMRYIR